MVNIEHCGDRPVQFNVSADGYEYDQKEFELKEGTAGVWNLKPAKLTSGVIVSAATGEAIANATLAVVETQGPFHHGSDPYNPKVIAYTNEDGRFELTSLRSDTTYLFLITADGYGINFPYRIMAGQENLEIELGQELYIRGKIKGDLEALQTYRDKTLIHYSNPYRTSGDSTSSHQKSMGIDVRDGIGHFEIDGLWAGMVRIYAGKHKFMFNLEQEPLEDVVIDLTPEAIEETKRKVVLKFDVPEGAPAVTGGCRIDYISEQNLGQGMTPKWLDIENGQASIDIPVPGRFKYSIDYHQGNRPIGYWFEEIRETEVGIDEEPMVFTVPSYPAGAIFGQVLVADGNSQDDFWGTILVIKKPSMVQNVHSIDGILQSTPEGKYNVSPLPLGGTYAIVVKHENTYVVSDAIALTTKEPIREVDMRLVEGVTVSGRVVDADGKGLQCQVSLNVSIQNSKTDSWGTGGSRIRTDKDGRFAIENVNPDVPGDYTLNVIVKPGYRPLRMKLKDLRKPLTIQIQEAVGVKGVVIDDATGWPVPDVQVHAYLVDDPGRETAWEHLEAESSTNEKGEFVFSNMGRRKYRLNAMDANPVKPHKPVKVMGGQAEPVTLRIVIPKWSHLKAREPVGQ